MAPHIENIEDSQLSINSEPDASEDRFNSLSQVREQEAQQYHEISSPPLSEGSSAEYMSEADISGNTPLVPLSAEEELEGLLPVLELGSTSSNSNELVDYCKRGIRRISVVKDLENNLQNHFDTEEEPFKEPATADADILTLCLNGKSLREDTNRTAGGHKNRAGYNNDCNQSIINQINSEEPFPPSTPIAKNGQSKKSELDFDGDVAQQGDWSQTRTLCGSSRSRLSTAEAQVPHCAFRQAMSSNKRFTGCDGGVGGWIVKEARVGCSYGEVQVS